MTNTDKERADFEAMRDGIVPKMMLSPDEDRLAFWFYRAGREAERAEAVTGAESVYQVKAVFNGYPDAYWRDVTQAEYKQAQAHNATHRELYTNPPKPEPSLDVEARINERALESLTESIVGADSPATAGKPELPTGACPSCDGTGLDLYDGTERDCQICHGRGVAQPLVLSQTEPPADLVESARKWWGLSDYSSSAYNEYERVLVIMAAFAQEIAGEATKKITDDARAAIHDFEHDLCDAQLDVAHWKARADKAEKALEDEREACAQIVEKYAPASQDMMSTMIAEVLDAAAAAIRARKGGGDE